MKFGTKICRSLFILSALLLGVVSESKGQFQQNGNDLYYSSGNVGIGLTNPTRKFHVFGESRFDGSATVNGDLSIGPTIIQNYQFPRGIDILSYGLENSNPARVHIGLQRKNYISQGNGTGQDITDKVGVFIKGYYHNVGGSIPIYLGGNGFQSDDFKMMIDETGNVGIGVRDAPHILLVYSSNNADRAASFISGDYYGPAVGTRSTSSNYYAFLVMNAVTTAEGGGGNSAFVVKADGNTGVGTYTPRTKLDVEGNALFTGKIGIGTANIVDNNFRLFVETGIRTRKIKVDQTNWPDYVFSSTYLLPDINDVARFIQKYNHLPEIPTATEVARNGIDVGDNLALLLKKLEELTLYMIDQNEKNKIQQAEIEALKSELNKLKNRTVR